MREKYTQQDVQRLVEAAEEHINALRDGILVASLWCDLDKALAPFRPDQEEYLVRRMLKTQMAAYGNLIKDHTHDEASYLSMKASLSIAKEADRDAPTNETQEGTGTTAGQ